MSRVLEGEFQCHSVKQQKHLVARHHRPASIAVRGSRRTLVPVFTRSRSDLLTLLFSVSIMQWALSFDFEAYGTTALSQIHIFLHKALKSIHRIAVAVVAHYLRWRFEKLDYFLFHECQYSFGCISRHGSECWPVCQMFHTNLGASVPVNKSGRGSANSKQWPRAGW